MTWKIGESRNSNRKGRCEGEKIKGGRGEKIHRFLFSLPNPTPPPPRSLLLALFPPLFGFNMALSRAKTFARPRKTPALQAIYCPLPTLSTSILVHQSCSFSGEINNYQKKSLLQSSTGFLLLRLNSRLSNILLPSACFDAYGYIRPWLVPDAWFFKRYHHQGLWAPNLGANLERAFLPLKILTRAALKCCFQAFPCNILQKDRKITQRTLRWRFEEDLVNSIVKNQPILYFYNICLIKDVSPPNRRREVACTRILVNRNVRGARGWSWLWTREISSSSV